MGLTPDQQRIRNGNMARALAAAAAVAIAIAFARFHASRSPIPATAPATTSAPATAPVVSASQPVPAPAPAATVPALQHYAIAAAFNRPPYDEVSGPFQIGVKANAGLDGIASVQFTVDGLPPVSGRLQTASIPTARINAKPLLHWCATFDADQLPPGEFTVTADIASRAGVRRTLSIILFRHDPDAPVFTLGKDFASIGDACILAPDNATILVPDPPEEVGYWEAAFTRQTGFRHAWIRFVSVGPISPMVKVSVPGSDPRWGKIELNGLRLFLPATISWPGGEFTRIVNCTLDGDGNNQGDAPAISAFDGVNSGRYSFTGGTVTNFESRAPFTNADFIGWTVFQDIGAHPVNNPMVLMNCRFDGVHTSNPDAHLDAMFFMNWSGVVDGFDVSRCEGLVLYGENLKTAIIADGTGSGSGLGDKGPSQLGKAMDGYSCSDLFVYNVVLANQRLVPVGVNNNVVYRNSSGYDGVPACDGVVVVYDPAPPADMPTDAAGFDLWFMNVGNTPLSPGYSGGDYNHDGLVDAADYDVWFKFVGSQ